MLLFHSPDYTRSATAFDTTRKAAWIAASLARDPIPGVELVAPAPLTREQLLTAHSAAYVDAVRTGEPRELAESQGFEWDEGMWPMVCASNGGVLAATLHALRTREHAGSLSSGLHHARRDHGSGVCTFNGLAVAAHAALAAGADRVAVLDLDAHCGGGTVSIVSGEPRIVHADVSTNSFDSYTPSEFAHLEVVRSADRYLAAVTDAVAWLSKAIDDASAAVCIYNAGMDPAESCSTGGMSGVTPGVLAERERMVFAWARERALPVAFVLAGGYTGARLDQAALVALHRLTIAAAAGG